MYPIPAPANCPPAPAAAANSLRRRRIEQASASRNALQNLAGKPQQVGNTRKQPCMAASSLQQPGIFILHLALDQPMAQSQVSSSVGGIRARAAGRRAKSGRAHPQRLIHLPPHPCGKVLAVQHIQRLAQQDEPGVGVLRARSRLRLQRQLQASAQQRLRPLQRP